MADFLQGASSGKIFISVIIASNLVFLVTMIENICLFSPICQQMSIQTQSLSHPQIFPECIHNVIHSSDFVLRNQIIINNEK